MPKQWITPAGTAQNLYLNMLKQPHLLIAGSTGSGKSVLINGIIYTSLFYSPNRVELILIDPKRVELAAYKDLPHCIRYASEPRDMAAALTEAIDTMEQRYKVMQQQRAKEWDGGHLYIIIDEFADLMTTQKAETLPQLLRIAQLGRAARVHLIAATQRPTTDIINGQIKVNMDSRVALRCPTAQDSRNIIGIKCAETLPRYGYGYYTTPETMHPVLIQIPLTPPENIAARIKWWTDQKDPPANVRTKRRPWWQR